MKKYAIGDMAAKLGVTPSFLKYYERQGLIVPHTAANGYRYYTLEDTELVCECVRLKNLGFSANEIRELLTDADYPHMLDMMNERRQEMEKQIRYMEYLRFYIDRLSSELPSYEATSNWTIGIHNDFYYFPQSRGSIYLDDPAADRLSREWMTWLPVTINTAKADMRLGPDQEVEWGLSIDRPFADAQGVTVTPPAVYVPNCRCLEFWDKRELRQTELDSDALFTHMRQVVERLHLVIMGPSYFFVRTKLHEDGKRYTYQKILTPIE